MWLNIKLSGGYGTLEELLEVIAWAQLGIHDKPVCKLHAIFDEMVNLNLCYSQMKLKKLMIVK